MSSYAVWSEQEIACRLGLCCQISECLELRIIISKIALFGIAYYYI